MDGLVKHMTSQPTGLGAELRFFLEEITYSLRFIISVSDLVQN